MPESGHVCEICEKETGEMQSIWNHKFCEHCLMLAIDRLKAELKEFEALLEKENRFLH